VSASSPVFDLCLAGEMRPCARRALRLTLQGTLAYVATSTGLAVVDLSTPTAPKLLSAQTSGAIEDVAVSGHLAFLAAGAQGLSVVDITEPALPLTLPPLVDPSSVALNATITQAHGVQIGALPTQTWLFVADGANGIRAVNVSALYDPYRDRPGSLSAPTGLPAAHAALTLERRDPFSPRDTTVPADHLAFPVVTFPTHAPAPPCSTASATKAAAASATPSTRAIPSSPPPSNPPSAPPNSTSPNPPAPRTICLS